MSGRVRVKICGLTRQDDVALAVHLGADAVGFVFWPGSPRAVAPEHVRLITAGLPALVTRVGVFVNMPAADVARIVDVARLDAAQLHGEEDIASYRGVATRLIKGASLVDDSAIEAASVLPLDVTPLVDAHDPARRGGTGQAADWTRAAVLARRRAVILAGGLHAANVGDAIEQVQPWAVDVSSGVESSAGVKSAEKLRAFFAAIEHTTSTRRFAAGKETQS